jgi:hypothetical protein
MEVKIDGFTKEELNNLRWKLCGSNCPVQYKYLVEELKRRCPKWFIDTKKENQTQLVSWIQTHKNNDGTYNFPKQHSADINESRFGSLLRNYVTPTKRSKKDAYDKNFVSLLKEKFGYKYKSEITLETKEKINIFILKYGFKPPSNSSKFSKEVNSLGVACLGFSYKNGECYDEEFTKKYENIPSYREWCLNKKAQEAIDFYNKNGFIPPQSNKIGSFIKTVKEGSVSNFNSKLCSIILDMKNSRDIKRQQLGLPEGVRKRGNKFAAYICRGHKFFSLGTFTTLEEASLAHEKAKEQH